MNNKQNNREPDTHKTIEIYISTADLLEEQKIEKLKEYKASLINWAVTGKIKRKLNQQK